MLRAVGLLVAALLIAPAWAQTRPSPPSRNPAQANQLDASPAMFAVMAAITAGGYNLDGDSASNHPLRKAVREHFAKLTLPSVDALRRYVRDHKPKNAALEFSQYVSLGLLIKNPPEFGLIHPELPLPPDVAPLDDFLPLLEQFYKEANVEALWKEVQPAYDQEISLYTEPVSTAILQVNAYFRNITSGFLGRRFQIIVELLGPPNQVQRRGYLDDDFVVVTPVFRPKDPKEPIDLPIDEIRHAYLHYLADPLKLKFADNIRKKLPLHDYALGSPILDEIYRKDFVELTAECFIKAVESKIARKPAMAQQAMREGFVLTPAFAELLTGYERQEQAMRLYFPDLVAGLDFKKEEKRLDHIDFVSERPTKTVRITAERQVELKGVEKTLDGAEELYTRRDLGRAKEMFLRVLQETSEKPMHAKAYYGLARIAVLEKDPETGDRLFRKVLEFEPDAATHAWSELYLGRLADSQNERAEAQEHYKAALAVGGAPDSVRQAADKGLKEAFSRN